MDGGEGKAFDDRKGSEPESSQRRQFWKVACNLPVTEICMDDWSHIQGVASRLRLQDERPGPKRAAHHGNAGVHNMRDISLKAVKLVYFPKNTKSCIQPCDAGIIQALKLKYREQLHNHILGCLSSEQTADDDPLKAINIALVMVWIFRAWKKVEKRIISKCFGNRGFCKVGIVADLAPAMKFGYCDELEQEELDMQVREDDDKVLFSPQETPRLYSIWLCSTTLQLRTPEETKWISAISEKWKKSRLKPQGTPRLSLLSGHCKCTPCFV
ncbi:Tigger transposable element-derived protein 4-like [Oopsacas minuta]|uniref:Tigger transposable element-derived protein 4-like n=1 Tax=Oopsacas minuta TaxID=111878 RepID=A0AAV7JM34_9METZ|nr:Tigger transposable element-derived protein 4-like [Oopsacas minuta]